MSNIIHNFEKLPSMPERLLSALAYISFGAVGIILLIASALMKTNLRPFVKFNVYQSILIGFAFAILQVTFDLITAFLQLFNYIPVIGTFLNSLFLFIIYYLMGFPILFGMPLLKLIILILIIYLTIVTFRGKTPYLPIISNAIRRIS